jgi:hypothetical protein
MFGYSSCQNVSQQGNMQAVGRLCAYGEVVVVAAAQIIIITAAGGSQIGLGPAKSCIGSTAAHRTSSKPNVDSTHAATLPSTATDAQGVTRR